MILKLSLDHAGPLHFQEGLPNGFNGKVLPGGSALCCIEEFGTLTIQEIKSELYVISFQTFDFLKSVSLQWKPAEPKPFSCFAIKNDLLEFIPGFGKIRIRQGQVSFQGQAIAGGRAEFEKGKSYESLYTGYDPPLLEDFDPIAVTSPQWAGKALLRWIDDIFSNDLRPDFRRRYFENKVREYLLLQFGSRGTGLEKKHGLLPHELAAVYETLRIISADMKEHIPIAELANRMKLKNFHLKNIFQRFVGMNIYEYQLYKKMMEARNLLLQTELGEKEIAAKLGYRSNSSFTTAFRKYFGSTPSALRVKKFPKG